MQIRNAQSGTAGKDPAVLVVSNGMKNAEIKGFLEDA